MAQPQEKRMGIHEIYRPKDSEASVDIVAIHGLNGDAIKTWTAKSTGICWLSHQDYLPKHIPAARVLVFGYNASISNLTGQTPSSDRIHHHAQTLVQELYANRRLEKRENFPIVFLCHSLGGIIVKRAISYAKEKNSRHVAHLQKIFTCTYGILFFGTPHHGSSEARLLGTLQNPASAVPRRQLQTESELVKALQEESETLQNINDYFVNIMKRFRIYFFWEQQPSNLAHTKDYIVTKESAAPPFGDTERAGIAADHSGMVKFESNTAQGFRLAVTALDRYCEEASNIIRKRLEEANTRLEQDWQSEALEHLDDTKPTVPPPRTVLLGHQAPAMIQSREQLEEYMAASGATEQLGIREAVV